MKIKRILLTGDDGYNSIGTRLLIHALKDKYDLTVAATKHQQSAVGGKLSLSTGGVWGETEVDGVPALWVEGSPADVMECSQGFFKEKFDLIISGINLGLNASTAVISSGTFCAAIRGMGLQIAPRALVMSWDTATDFWLKKHDENEDLTPYLKYPGAILPKLLDLVFKNELWGSEILNINFPSNETKEIRFTKILKDITKLFRYPITIDEETHRFSYQNPSDPFNVQEFDIRYDAAAIKQGYISITPCARDMTHFSKFTELNPQKLTLD